jgi:N-acetylmuramoyl-L-alanine amidase
LKWKSDGYHRIVDLEGNVLDVVDFENISNGVKNFNSKSIHIAYIGGVEKDNVNKAIDSRTFEQKQGLLVAIEEAINWIVDHGGSKRAIKILGHRDISPDQNGNGKIDSWERIKECPSFDAIPEYKDVLNWD